ncbi:MAG: InlB B-repeat-containing protein [Lachnospiraceae bacterium]|nr:InlB B-repeat-containing protein [Lachnospiraceae bacterium]
MNFKRLVSIVLCVAMVLTNANFSFALDSEAIQSMTQSLKSSEDLLEFESDINNEENETDVDASEVDDAINSTAEDDIEEETDQTIESDILDEIESESEDDIEDETDSTTESNVSDEIEPESEDVIEDETDSKIESDVLDEIDKATESEIIDDTEQTTESEIIDDTEQTTEAVIVDSEVSIATESEMSDADDIIIDEIIDFEIVATESNVDLLTGSVDADIATSSEANTEEEIEPFFGYVAPDIPPVEFKKNNRYVDPLERLLGESPLPESYDSREKTNDFGVSIVPPIRNQYPYGTCWAFATIGLMEINLRKKNLLNASSEEDYDEKSDMSEAAFSYYVLKGLKNVTNSENIDKPGVELRDYNDLDPDYYTSRGYDAPNFGNAGGNFLYAAFVGSTYMGATRESNVPYSLMDSMVENGLPPEKDKYAFNENAVEMNNVHIISKVDRDAVKRAIMEHGAVGISYHAGQESSYSKEINGEHYYMAPRRLVNGAKVKSPANHGVIVVGWNDNVPAENFINYNISLRENEVPGGPGAWLVRNSWGDENAFPPYKNAKEGYFWLSYYDLSIDNNMYAIDVVEADTYKYNYHYDTTASAGYLYSVNHLNTTEVGNIFKVTGETNQKLDAVNIAHYSPISGGKIKIYTSDEAMENPTDGELRLTQNLTHSGQGIFTIPLNSSISLKRDTYFSVVLDIPNNVQLLVDESVDYGSNSDRPSMNEVALGQSLYKDKETGEWIDLNREGIFRRDGMIYGSNFRIRALTNETGLVSFDSNGGEGFMEGIIAEPGETIKLPKNVFTKKGCKFIGWVDDAGNEYGDEAEIEVNDNISLKAKWEEVVYHLPYDWFNSTTKNKKEITKINILVYPDSAPTDVNETWDIAESDGLKGYIKGTEVYIYAPTNGNIYLPEDSSYMFSSKRYDEEGNFIGADLENSFVHVEELNGLTNLNTSRVQNMERMFAGLGLFNMCDSLEDWPFPLKANPKSVNLDLSSFDTSNVTNMSLLFEASAIESIDISHFDTRKVETMNWMFAQCELLKSVDLSSIDTRSLTSVEGMFEEAISLTSINLESFTLENVTSLNNMFTNLRSITSIDISSFDISNVTQMNEMFAYCENLEIIYASSTFNTSSVTESDNMFEGCLKLVGGNGTEYNDTNPKDKTYARVDVEGTPGYFTASGYVTVTFDLGGKGENFTRLVENHKKVERPEDPVAAGYIFYHWYDVEVGESVEFNFDTLFHIRDGQNRTLKASWDKKRIRRIEGLSAPTRRTYNVGDAIDLTGLRVKLYFRDDTTAEITYSDLNRDDFSAKTNYLQTEDKVSDRSFVTVLYTGDLYCDNNVVMFDDNTTNVYEIDITDINDRANYLPLDKPVLAYSTSFIEDATDWEDFETPKNFFKDHTLLISYVVATNSTLDLTGPTNTIALYKYGMDDATCGDRGYRGLRNVEVADENLVNHKDNDNYFDAYYRGKYLRVYGINYGYFARRYFYVFSEFGEADSIEVVSAPLKLDYVKGEDRFDPTGLVIKVANYTYNLDGKLNKGINPESGDEYPVYYKTITYDGNEDHFDISIEKDHIMTDGDNQVTITFLGKSCTLDLNLLEPGERKTVSLENGYDGGLITSVSIPAGNKMATPSVPIREHWTFDKWVIKGTGAAVDFNNYIIEDDITFEATWIGNEYEVVLYGKESDWTYHLNPKETRKRRYGEEYTLPNATDPVWANKNPQYGYEGTEVVAWLDVETGETITTISENDGRKTIKLYPVMGEAREKIDYDLNGGKWADGFTPRDYKMFNETFLLPTPSNVYKRGHTLSTWHYTSGYATYGGGMSEIPAGFKQSSMGSSGYFTIHPMKAIWEVGKYKVHFVENGGTWIGDFVNPADRIFDTLFTMPNSTDTRIKREGYRFGGWYEYPDFSGNSVSAIWGNSLEGDKTYYAKWEPITYTIAYNVFNSLGERLPDGVENIVTKTFGVPVVLATPSKANHQFTGWWTGPGYGYEEFGGRGERYYGNTDLTTDNYDSIDIYPSWEPNKYTVQFDLRGVAADAISPITKSWGVNISSSDLPTPMNIADGYEFLGWYNEPELSNKWNGNSDLTNEHGATKTVYAKWKTALVYNANGHGTAPASKEIVGSTTVSLPSITATGYTFDGWYNNATDFSVSNRVGAAGESFTTSAPTTLYAKWIANVYTINYNANGGTVTPASFDKTYDTAYAGELATPTRDGWTFDGWYTTSAYTTEYDKTADNIYKEGQTTPYYIYAKWTAKTYTINYDTNGGTLTGDTSFIKTFGTAITSNLAVPTKTGYTFVGWFTDNTTFNNEYNKANDNIYEEGKTSPYYIYAKWTAKTYTINYKANGGNITGDTSFEKTFDTPITSDLAAPTKTGYRFDGWFRDNTTFNTEYNKANDDIYEEGKSTYDIYAKWTANTYSIRFNLNAVDANVANNISDLTKVYGTNATLPTLTNVKQGYRFIGWYENVECTGTAYDGTTDLSNVQGDTKQLYARWGITLTFYISSTGDTKFEYELATPSMPMELPTMKNKTEPGWRVEGWYDGPDASTATKIGNSKDLIPITAPMSMYAHWVANTYTIKYVLNDGTLGRESITKTCHTDITLDTPTRVGYTFDRWYKDSNLYYPYTGTIDLSFEQDDVKEIYAKWVAKNYTIKYNLNDGTLTGATTFTKTYDTNYSGTLATPTKTGYTFGGWFTDNGTFNTRYNKSNDDIYVEGTVLYNIYAKWIAKAYTINYNANGGTITGNTSFTKTYGTAITTDLAEPTKEGYTFDGWYTTSALATAYDKTTDGIYVEGTNTYTIYAKWNANQYTVDYNLVGVGATKPSPITKTYSTALAASELKSPTYIPAGYEFLGWFKSYDSTTGTYGAKWEGKDDLSNENGATVYVYAKWKRAVVFNVQYNGTNINASQPTSIEITSATTITLPNTSATGYTFGGWYREEELINSVGMNGATGVAVDGPTTFYAKWTANVYTINYNTVLSGVTISENNTSKTYGVNKTLAAPSKDGYDFAGWFRNYNIGNKTYSDQYDGTSDIISTNGGSTTIYAKWTAHTYTIKYNVNGVGTAPADKVKTYDTATTLANPTNIPSGYTFDGWYSNADLNDTNKYTGNTDLTTSNAVEVNVYARWKARITYNANGHGTIPAPTYEDIILGQVTQLKTLADVPGFTFDIENSWYGESACTNLVGKAGINYTVTEPKTLYAKWNENSYTVTLHVDGGAFAAGYTDYTLNSTTNNYEKNRLYTAGATLPTSQNITKTGYVFDGWYENSGFTGSKVTSVAAKTASDKEYWLKWSIITYNVTYNVNKGTWADGYTAPTSWTVESAATTNLPTGANVNRAHYNFEGWYENSDFSGSAISSLVGKTSNLTLHAKWTLDTSSGTYHTITYNPNGGSGNMETQYAFEGEETTLYANEFTRSGYTFSRWKT